MLHLEKMKQLKEYWQNSALPAYHRCSTSARTTSSARQSKKFEFKQTQDIWDLLERSIVNTQKENNFVLQYALGAVVFEKKLAPLTES